MRAWAATATTSGVGLGVFLAIILQVLGVRPALLTWPSGHVRSLALLAFGPNVQPHNDGSIVGKLLERLPKDSQVQSLAAADVIDTPMRAGLPWFFDYSDRTTSSEGNTFRAGESFSSLYAALVNELADRYGTQARPGYIARAWLRLSRSQTLNQNDPDIGFVRTVQTYMLDEGAATAVYLNQGGFTEQRSAMWQDGRSGTILHVERGGTQSAWANGNNALVLSSARSKVTCRAVVLGDWYDPDFLKNAFRFGPKDITRKYRAAPDDLSRVPYCVAILSPGPIEIQAPFGFVGSDRPAFVQAGDILPGEMTYRIDQRSVRQSGGAWAAIARGTPAVVAVAYRPVGK